MEIDAFAAVRTGAVIAGARAGQDRFNQRHDRVGTTQNVAELEAGASYHRGNGRQATFGLSTQNTPATWRRSKTGASLLLHIGISTEKQFEQAALHPEFQMLAILSARPITNLRHRGCRSSAILLKHVEQSLRL